MKTTKAKKKSPVKDTKVTKTKYELIANGVPSDDFASLSIGCVGYNAKNEPVELFEYDTIEVDDDFEACDPVDYRDMEEALKDFRNPKNIGGQVIYWGNQDRLGVNRFPKIFYKPKEKKSKK